MKVAKTKCNISLQSKHCITASQFRELLRHISNSQTRWSWIYESTVTSRCIYRH